MTTSSEPPELGDDAPTEGAPFLPPSVAQPQMAPQSDLLALAGAAVPTLPPVQPSAPQTPPELVEFDAKAMVESQKHVNQNPAYGALPTSTPESAEAARKLRAKAHRKRQRNRMVGWFVALIMLGGIGAACWFAYQAFQDDQEQLDADRAEAQADGSAGAPDPLTPLGNQQEVIEAIEDVNSGATASAGGLLGAVEDAQAAVDDINGDDGTTQTPVTPGTIGTGTAPPAVVAVLPEFRSIDFGYRIYPSAAVGSSFTDYGYLYDHLDDNYRVFVQRVDGQSVDNTLYAFTGEWRGVIPSDGGISTRAPRSEASLDPAVDSPWATVFGEEAVLPATARPYARPLDGADTAATDEGLFVQGYVLDIDAWRAADPVGHEAWLSYWTAPAADSDTLVLDTGHQRPAEPTEPTALKDLTPADLGFLEGPIDVDGAAISFALTQDGYVRSVAILNAADDFRAVWNLLELSEGQSRFEFDDLAWIDDP